MTLLREAFDYPFSRLDPLSEHIDPPSIAVYETLLVKGTDGRAHPGLASVEEISPSGLEWTLRLRHGARFHSGAVCDARAVLECLEALRWQGGEHRQLWYWDPVDQVSVVDDQTLRFTLHHPYPRLPSLLWGTHTAIFNLRVQQADPEAFGVTCWDGTGAFRVESWAPGRVAAVRHEDPGHLPRSSSSASGVVWTSILDAAERVAALREGIVDCLHSPGDPALDELDGDPRFTVYEKAQSSSMYLALNWDRTDLGFDDVRVRRAISAALDRSRLVADALYGHGFATFGPVPPESDHYDPHVDSAGVYDPRASAAQLTRLGWRPGSDGVLVRDGARLSFECVTQDDPVFARVAAGVAEQLRAVGIEVRVHAEKPFADFYEAVAKGPDSSISKWLWQDPLDALIGFCSSGTAPFPNWSNAQVPELDACFAGWLRAESDEALAAAAHQVQRVFVAHLPYVPLLVPTDVWAWSTRVRGFEPSPRILYPRYESVTV